MSNREFDYIIAGAGCSGLTLAVHLIQSGSFTDKKILIVDKSQKDQNDRTWCFWEHDSGLFEAIVYRHWNTLFVQDEQNRIPLDLAEYNYKLIRGIDFYQYALGLIEAQTNFTVIYGNVEAIDSESTAVVVDGTTFSAEYVFNSILEKPEFKNNEIWLLQHFRGWRIKTNEPKFNSNEATLMDFRTDQKGATAFFYVLPFSQNEALVEYTLFSDSVMEEYEYEAELKKYISRNISPDFTVLEKESGIIPMTNAKFPQSNRNIINIGSAGGLIKGSSGYTFKFIQKHSKAIVRELQNGRHPGAIVQDPPRFRFYDSVLLDLLSNRILEGRKIFMRMFIRNSAPKVLRFLDNESSLVEDFSLIRTLPIRPFLKAALRQLMTNF